MSFIKFDLKEDFYTKEEIESELEDLNVLMEDLQDRLDNLSLNIDGEGVLRLTTDDNNNVYVGNLYTTKSYVDNKVSEILTRLGVSSSENGVLLLGNKSVIQSGDVATFIVTVYGENNLVVSDEEVTFEFYSSIDDSLLDTIVKTTSFKGIASCTYTGVGRGSVYCKASIQRNSSIIVSGTYEVIDCSVLDRGINSDYNDSMWSNVTYFTRGDEYSTLTNTSQVLMYTAITNNTGVVCDIMLDTTENEAFITVRNGSTSKKGLARSDLNLSNNVWYRLKIEIKDSNVVFSVGSDSTTSFTLDEFNRLYFRTGANETMKLKNIGKYSI